MDRSWTAADARPSRLRRVDRHGARTGAVNIAGAAIAAVDLVDSAAVAIWHGP